MPARIINYIVEKQIFLKAVLHKSGFNVQIGKVLPRSIQYRIKELRSSLVWKELIRPLNLTMNLILLSPLLNHVPAARSVSGTIDTFKDGESTTSQGILFQF